ncbi:hypothetical protein LZ31DRAFT_241610 [Colletotrichum somersetense]|nr:hypothetical protein LZ31DRAFT_241610 [Colletotrichum somersetense]
MAESTDGTGNRGRRNQREEEDRMTIESLIDVVAQSIAGLEGVDDSPFKHRVVEDAEMFTGRRVPITNTPRHYEPIDRVRPPKRRFNRDSSAQTPAQTPTANQQQQQPIGDDYVHKSRFTIQAESIGQEIPTFDSAPHNASIVPAESSARSREAPRPRPLPPTNSSNSRLATTPS